MKEVMLVGMGIGMGMGWFVFPLLCFAISRI